MTNPDHAQHARELARDEFKATWYTSITKEDASQLLHDAENLRDYAQSAEPSGVARVMVEVAEHLEELFGNGK